MKNLFKVAFFVQIGMGNVFAEQADPLPPPWDPCIPDYYNATTCSLKQNGYSCAPRTAFYRYLYLISPQLIENTSPWCWSAWGCSVQYNSCSKTVDVYSASKNNEFTLTGTRTPTLNTVNIFVSMFELSKPSPFIYLRNAPNGPVSVSLSSALDSYSPKPFFNKEMGWDLNVDNSAISLNGIEVDHLFYELALKKIEMTRNGRNFISKDKVIAFLNDSDFLTKLGFNEEEKRNSLGYLIPKILEASDTEFYYLTVLDSESIANVSTLNITPKPDRIDRLYFAVYPTNVPVRTDSDFVFPKTEKEDGFTVKETGEFLIDSGMFVFFK
jgi:hypothetical protein